MPGQNKVIATERPIFGISRPALFDWLVLTTSFSLSFIFPNFLSVIISPVLPFLMLAAMVLYTTGALLKHLPLDQRAKMRSSGFTDLPYKTFLAIGHWIIIYIAILFTKRAITQITGLNVSSTPPGKWDYFMLVDFVLTTYITYMVFHIRKGKAPARKYTEKYLFRRELVADIFLCISVSILTFIFWEKGIMSLFTYRQPREITDILFMFLLLAICFILFYLPLRYLFLVEDHSSRQTWQRFLLIFGFLMIRSLFILLNR